MPKKKLVRKCFCARDRKTTCGDCDREYVMIELGQEAEDVLSALSYFRSKWADRKGSVATRTAMEKIQVRIRQAMRTSK